MMHNSLSLVEYPRPEGCRVRAQATSDDGRMTARFDAALGFETDDDETLAARLGNMDATHWKSSIEVDYVFYAVVDLPVSAATAAVWALNWYLDSDPEPLMPNGDPVGFECYINEEDAKAWCQVNRPDAYALYLVYTRKIGSAPAEGA